MIALTSLSLSLSLIHCLSDCPPNPQVTIALHILKIIKKTLGQIISIIYAERWCMHLVNMIARFTLIKKNIYKST